MAHTEGLHLDAARGEIAAGRIAVAVKLQPIQLRVRLQGENLRLAAVAPSSGHVCDLSAGGKKVRSCRPAVPDKPLGPELVIEADGEHFGTAIRVSADGDTLYRAFGSQEIPAQRIRVAIEAQSVHAVVRADH